MIEVDKAGSSFRPVKGRPASFGFTHRRTHCAVAILDQLTTDACTLHLCGQHPDRIEGLTALLFVLRGEVRVGRDEIQHRIGKNSVFLYDFSQPVSLNSSEETDFLHILVANNYFRAHVGFGSKGFYDHTIGEDSAVNRLFIQLLRTICATMSEVDARDIANICDGIFCCLRPVVNGILRAEPEIYASAADKLRARAYNVMASLVPYSNVTVEQIAERCQISPRRLSALFKDAGTTVMAHLMRIRLERASVQLKEPHCDRLSVEAIGRANGFATTAHFCRCFKERFGMTPGQWRKQSGPG